MIVAVISYFMEYVTDSTQNHAAAVLFLVSIRRVCDGNTGNAFGSVNQSLLIPDIYTRYR